MTSKDVDVICTLQDSYNVVSCVAQCMAETLQGMEPDAPVGSGTITRLYGFTRSLQMLSKELDDRLETL